MSITPEEHSGLVGGSTAAQRLHCPRSYTIEKTVPKVESDTIYAREGTALHELMAIALEKDVEPTTLLPFTFTASEAKGGWSFTVDDTLWLEKGEPALAAFDAFVAAHEDRVGAQMRLLIETRVAFPGIPGAFGTSDIMGVCGNEIFVMDWKFGNGIVPAEENEQLMFYACGALNTSRDFFSALTLTADTPVTMAIVQPTREGIVDHWTTDLGRLQRFETELQAAVREAEVKGDTARIKKGPWCKFKRCNARCPLRVGAAQTLSDKFDELKRAVEGKANDLPETLGDMMDLVDLVEPMCKEVRSLVERHIADGGTVARWEAKPGRAGALKWVEDDTVVIAELDRLGLDREQVAPRKVLTPTQVEKLVGELPEGLAARGDPSKPSLRRRKEPRDDIAVLAARIASPA